MPLKKRILFGLAVILSGIQFFQLSHNQSDEVLPARSMIAAGADEAVWHNGRQHKIKDFKS